jgi:threonine dehydrogenase-like Zn-dependent dehydrogenase
MRRLMAMVANRRVDLTPLVTHHFGLDDIQDALELFSARRDGVMKIAITPARTTDLLQKADATVGVAD